MAVSYAILKKKYIELQDKYYLKKLDLKRAETKVKQLTESYDDLKKRHQKTVEAYHRLYAKYSTEKVRRGD